jgi:Domain of unknown function (DUF4272)
MILAGVAVLKGARAQEESGQAGMSEEEARKARSIAILRREGVPYIDHLPLIEGEDEIMRRTDEDVAIRALALSVVAVKAESLDQALTEQLIARFQLAGAFTPEEQAFIANPQPSTRDRNKFGWRYECLWVLLWALGFVEKLGRPDHIMDAGQGVGIIKRLGRDGFLAQARLRPAAELLDAADLIYRYDWAVVDARIKQHPAPADLNPDVVVEWHYALNWLIAYGGQEWDDVSTDT